jgi:hypothetical protein
MSFLLPRQRLQSLSWFMKCLKEPLSRLANRQDKTHGTFFEGRFKSVAGCAEEAHLATSVYIDLNPVAAQVATTPEKLRDGRLLGRFFATTRAKLREIAERLGMRRPVNVVGLSCLMTSDRITSNCGRPIASPTRENIAALMHL